MRPDNIYIPRDIGDVVDQLGRMSARAPQFRERTGHLPFMNLERAFLQLNGGLANIGERTGEPCHAKLHALSDKARALFNVDPEDKSGDAQKGRENLWEMMQILRGFPRKS